MVKKTRRLFGVSFFSDLFTSWTFTRGHSCPADGGKNVAVGERTRLPGLNLLIIEDSLPFEVRKRATASKQPELPINLSSKNRFGDDAICFATGSSHGQSFLFLLSSLVSSRLLFHSRANRTKARRRPSTLSSVGTVADENRIDSLITSLRLINDRVSFCAFHRFGFCLNVVWWRFAGVRSTRNRKTALVNNRYFLPRKKKKKKKETI